MTTYRDGMEFRRYQTPVDLYTDLRVKRSFRPTIEPIDSLDLLGVVNPEGSTRVGLARVPTSMIERSRGYFGAEPSSVQEERTWVVAEFPRGRYVALGQFVPVRGIFSFGKSLE